MKSADVVPALHNACPGFVPADPDLLYGVMGGLAHYLLAMKKEGREDVLRAAAAFIEQMHVEGDDYVRELATIGALEGIQNVWGNAGIDPSGFRPYLNRESKKWWDSLNRFWEGKSPHVGADK